MNYQLKIIIGVVLLLIVAMSVVFLSGGGGEDIQAFLDKGLVAAKNGDEETLVGMLSKSYQSGEEDYERMAGRLRAMFSEPRAETLTLVGVPSISVHDDQADVGITIKAHVGPRILREGNFRLTLQKEEREWKVTSVEELR